jgi:hypothetical protein
MNRKLVLALAVMSALGIATSGAIAQSDEEKKDEKKPEYSQLILVQSDDKKDEKKPELISQSDEEKKDTEKPQLVADPDPFPTNPSGNDLSAEGDVKETTKPELVA